MSAESTDYTTKNNSGNGGLWPISNGFYVAITYGIIFVPLMLVTGKEITVDTLGIPALLLFLFVNIVEFFITNRKKTSLPQWALISFFIISVATAIVVTLFSS